MNETALDIFEIERFAIHDGPGIRTTVFFQGCPLRCRWCANPESQTVGKHIMFFSRLCVGCGKCAEACGQNVVHVENGKSVIDRSSCISCGSCAEKCPCGALKISGQKISNDELFDIVSRDKDYYETSGGGVTISGGEALLQIEKMLPFLEKCKSEHISIAVETCGYLPVSNVKIALEYADLFLFDLKTLDSKKFGEYTGGNIETVLSAFEYLCKNAPEKVIVRVPVIPEFNDNEVSAIMEYAAAHGVKELHLLPYHTLGISKYEQLGRGYPYHIRESLDPDVLTPYNEKGAELGLTIKIGG